MDNKVSRKFEIESMVVYTNTFARVFIVSCLDNALGLVFRMVSLPGLWGSLGDFNYLAVIEEYFFSNPGYFGFINEVLGMAEVILP
ncbi:MAG: hypothetical protein NT166_17240 [Candidatus Aminicenantes bacterium]|nr:hypothetical protein [Candidatus Aminicenantes bacterium]